MNLNLSTERLSLSPLTDVDADLALEMFTDSEVVKYICDLMSEAMVKSEMQNWTKRGGNGCIGIWSIADRVSGEKYGSVFLLPIPVDEEDTNYSLIVPDTMPNSEIEIGFALKHSAWGKGYATESCKRLLKFAFEESPLNEIVATFHKENTASKHVLKKSGLKDRGHMRCYGEDGPCFRITRLEWDALHSGKLRQI